MLIKEWLDPHLAKSITPKFVQQLEVYRLGYIGQSHGHVQFYGSPYIGLHNIWFTSAYENKLLNYILKLDKQTLQADLTHVDRDGRAVKVPGIYPDRKVSGELFNIILLYLAHKLNKYPHPKITGQTAALIPLQIYAYRTLAAVHSNSFRYLASEGVAKAVYNNLSSKFILKQLKTWDKYILYRAEAGMQLANQHHVLDKFDNDEASVLILIMMSNSIRSTFKIMYQSYLDIKERGEGESSDTLRQEGEEVFVKDVLNTESIVQAILLKIADGSFVDVAIVKHVTESVPRTLYVDVFNMVKELSSSYITHKKEIDDLIKSMSSFMTERLRTMETSSHMPKHELIDKLYSAFGSSKTNSPLLDTARHIGTTTISRLAPNKSESYTARLRSALFRYIIVLWIKILN